ncbi:positive regulator AgmR [Vibrio tarriae]|uniref:Positive regulator AgmR n=2 Tax=Vibrio TaxID=662 RepID=A0A544M3A7_VIBCL|nr:positive regulator AgmR [Vibrio cholerae]EGR0209139.1 positive regulator AgmR [Vibrio vulnificus]MCG3731061.1 positive regulator AgmR [Vibrio cincinnatiensis]ORP22364.1 positive regulator AgmR [Vibrio paracholerae]PAR52267.1 positive regulator AgmR [Vibrio metoecus]RBM50476.1 positive regulator AgmR [Vibrio tarriae]
MKLLNYQRFLLRKYPTETQRLIRELSKHEADFSRALNSRF